MVPRFTRVNPVLPEQRGQRIHRTASPKIAKRKRPQRTPKVRIHNGDEEAGNDDDSDEDDDDYFDSDEDSEDSDEDGMTMEDLAKRADGKYSTPWIPLVSSGVPISGFVRIVAPSGRVIPHNGITATLETSLYALEELATRELYNEEIPISGPGELTGTIDLPYAFLNPANHPLPEEYEGDLFSIRHKVSIHISRPWYTFNVTADSPFAVQTVYHLPRSLNHQSSSKALNDTKGETKPSSISTPKSPNNNMLLNSPGGLSVDSNNDASGAIPSRPLPSELARDGSIFGPQVMALDGLPAGSSVVLNIDRGCYELKETIQGEIVCSDLSRPILLLKLAVIRIEYADGEAADNVIFDEAIMDARRWKTRKDRRLLIERMKKLALEEEEKRKAAEEAAARGETVESTTTTVVEGENNPELNTPISVSVTNDGATNVSSTTGTGPSDAPADGTTEGEQGSASKEGNEEEEEDVLDEWLPDPEEYEEEVPDPDLPILGDVRLTVDLSLSALRVTPTYVIDVTDNDDDDDKKKKGTTPKSPKPKDANDEDADRVTVRYFVRLTAYTDFAADARRWNAQEIILYRGQLYGKVIPPYRLPKNIAGYGTSSSEEIDDQDNTDNNVARTTKTRPGEAPLGLMLPAPLSSGLRLFGLGVDAPSLASPSGTGGGDKRFGRLAPSNDTSSTSTTNDKQSALNAITITHHDHTTSTSGVTSTDLASFLTRPVYLNGTSTPSVKASEDGTVMTVALPTLSEDDAKVLRGRNH